MAIFAVTLTVTLYAVTDMEYPRLGLIRIEDFDHFSSMLTSKCGDVGAIETSVLGRRMWNNSDLPRLYSSRYRYLKPWLSRSIGSTKVE
jgi:hypothetical protein